MLAEVEVSGHRKVQWMRGILIGAVIVLFSTFGAVIVWGVHRYYVRPILFLRHDSLPQIAIIDGIVQVRMQNGNLLAEVGDYSDELTAYLHFEYLQGLTAFSGIPILMTSEEIHGRPVYRLYAAMRNDVLQASHRLGQIRMDGFIGNFSLVSPATVQLRDWENQTRLFDAAYHQPVRKRLLELPKSQLTSAVTKFILFKVKTDQRVWKQILPVEKVVSPEESLEFAADMIAVANFYKIPLSMLLGVGAMENNYLDVRGDLKHSTWKRHAQPGDIILKRRDGRVLVSNYSMGPWQITRETLRYAHALYLKDHRDYSLLPPRLRPPRRLDLNNVDSHVLTTYAGLLLKDLLEKFHGNVTLAVGAYNGGAGNPNMHYAEGVAIVANYAHRVLSTAASMTADAVAKTTLKEKNNVEQTQSSIPSH